MDNQIDIEYELPTADELLVYAEWSKEDRERFYSKAGEIVTTPSVFADIFDDA